MKTATQWEWVLPDSDCNRSGLLEQIYKGICKIKPGTVPSIVDLLVTFMLINILKNGGMSVEFLWQECQKNYPQVRRSGFDDAFMIALAYATENYGLLKGGGPRPERCGV